MEVLDVCQKLLASSCKRLELLDFVLLCDGMPEWFGRWCWNSWNLSPESQKVGTELVHIAFSFGWHRFEACVADRFLLWRGPWISDELLSSSRGSFCRSCWLICWRHLFVCSLVLSPCQTCCWRVSRSLDTGDWLFRYAFMCFVASPSWGRTKAANVSIVSPLQLLTDV